MIVLFLSVIFELLDILQIKLAVFFFKKKSKGNWFLIRKLQFFPKHFTPQNPIKPKKNLFSSTFFHIISLYSTTLKTSPSLLFQVHVSLLWVFKFLREWVFSSSLWMQSLLVEYCLRRMGVRIPWCSTRNRAIRIPPLPTMIYLSR